MHLGSRSTYCKLYNTVLVNGCFSCCSWKVLPPILHLRFRLLPIIRCHKVIFAEIYIALYLQCYPLINEKLWKHLERPNVTEIGPGLDSGPLLAHYCCSGLESSWGNIMYNKLSHRKHTRGTNVEVLCVCEMQRILFVIRIKLDPLLIQYKPNLKKKVNIPMCYWK